MLLDFPELFSGLEEYMDVRLTNINDGYNAIQKAYLDLTIHILTLTELLPELKVLVE